jgi:hypothetical protein
VEKWICLFLKRIEAHFIKHTCTQNKLECPDLFGSNVIDFLECILDCKKDITVKIHSGWCYIKGQYKVCGIIWDRLPGDASGLESLSVYQQAELHNVLYNFAKLNNNYHLWRLRRCEKLCFKFKHYLTLENALGTDTYFFMNTYDPWWEGKSNLTFKVDLKCRKELAPIELLLELLKEQSYDDNEDESAPGTHIVQDPSPDLELKLETERDRSSEGEKSTWLQAFNTTASHR